LKAVPDRPKLAADSPEEKIMRTPRLLLLAVVALALSLTSPAGAAESNIAVVRVESLDAVIDDAQHIASRMGVEISGQNLMNPVANALGLPDLGWIDRTKPLVLVFPASGMMLGEKGVVGGLPVSDPAAALEAVTALLGVEPAESEGLYTFAKDDGTDLLVTPRGGYLVFGQVSTLVQGFDPIAALTMSAPPAGSLSAEIYLEPLAPMAMMGIQMGRQMLEQKLAEEQEPSASPEPHAEADPDADEHAHAHVEAGQMDPAAMSGIFDLYFSFFQDVLNNTSRIQLSLEVASVHVIVHKRLIPKTGSTLAGLAEAQKGGLPELARVIDPEGTTAAYAGQVTFTPKFTEAVRGYIDRYMAAMESLAPALDEASAEAPWLGEIMELLTRAETADQVLNCFRGDLAGSYSFGEGGVEVTQVHGAKDVQACKGMLDSWSAVLQAVPTEKDGQPLIRVTENAITCKGVSAMRQEMTFPIDFDAMADAEAEQARKALAIWTGEGGTLETYTGFLGDRVLSSTGPDAEATFRGLVDRASTKKSKGGITPRLFAPLPEGPGVFGMLDLASFLRALPVNELGADADKLAFLDQVPVESTRITYGARFDAGSVNFELALPLDWLNAIGEAMKQEEAVKEPPQEQG
jgi:hypothetical protein